MNEKQACTLGSSNTFDRITESLSRLEGMVHEMRSVFGVASISPPVGTPELSNIKMPEPDRVTLRSVLQELDPAGAGRIDQVREELNNIINVLVGG